LELIQQALLLPQ